jgi:hypothetical protein
VQDHCQNHVSSSMRQTIQTLMHFETIRILMLFEVATFFVASLIHAGMLIAGYEHHEARIAESVIAIILLASVVLTWIWPVWTRSRLRSWAR